MVASLQGRYNTGYGIIFRITSSAACMVISETRCGVDTIAPENPKQTCLSVM